MACPDLNPSINLLPAEMALGPKFAVSCKNLFIAFLENGQINLRCSPDAGNSLSGKKNLMQVAGPVEFLRISAREDIAVVAALEQTSTGIQIRGVTGTIRTPPQDPSEQVADFPHAPCTTIPLPGVSFQDILDLTIRINDDGTSDDFPIIKTGTGAITAHTGHHPHPGDGRGGVVRRKPL
jgi:hypothetical protein